MNPGLPLEPGQPGTILIVGKHDMPGLLRRPWSLFIPAPLKDVWLYMGEYKLAVCPTPLADTEFQNLPKTRIAWAVSILRHPSRVCFASARARIWLRKNWKAVTESSITETLTRHNAAWRQGSDIGLCEQDILKAFDSGEETLLVYLLLPLSYDVAFSEDMRSRWLRASFGGAPPQSEVEDEEGNQPIGEPEPPSASRR
ncbi:hypothetical protein BC834DRAFT_271427 [Gloeopeniophorella convolvens]|nr:hypothetical protein BC834DRAFT_271427 [Gloeopeniophorella convolvens]